jgi:hypothetical protein
MMFFVFATMLLALVVGWFGLRGLALFCIAACLAISIWEFLFEIYSPETGFRMPWIQVELTAPPRHPQIGDA